MNFEKIKTKKEQTISFKDPTKHSTRTKYFRIKISFHVLLITFKTLKVTAAFLRENKFPTQKHIEDVFLDLKLTDRGNQVKIDKVFGKLNLDSNLNLPYWDVFLQTTILTTKKKLKKAFLERLKLDDSLSFEVETFFEKDHWWQSKIQCELESNPLPDELEYRPGYFSDQTLLFVSLLETKEIERYIEDQGMANQLVEKQTKLKNN